MPNIIDSLLADVCLDERVTDGVFKMDEESHMDALRLQLERRGIPIDTIREITNSMLGEGNYPERQAWRTEDGILVTWATPERKASAMEKYPGKYTDKQPPKRTPARQPTAPTPQAAPASPNQPDTKELGAGEPEMPKGSNLFPSAGVEKTVSQGGQELEVEPPQGSKEPEKSASPVPSPPPEQQAPKTPEKIAAEKEVIKQIFATDDHALSKIEAPMTEQCRRELNELYKRADELGFKDAITFLTRFVKP